MTPPGLSLSTADTSVDVLTPDAAVARRVRALPRRELEDFALLTRAVHARAADRLITVIEQRDTERAKVAALTMTLETTQTLLHDAERECRDLAAFLPDRQSAPVGPC